MYEASLIILVSFVNTFVNYRNQDIEMLICHQQPWLYSTLKSVLEDPLKFNIKDIL